jgi:predicted Zn-dependent peptidase
MHEKTYGQLGETIFQETLDNGLQVYVLPKPDFKQAFATFSTKYGSIDREFVIPGEDQPTVVPDGIAHFLEHKMFEREDGDVFNLYAKYGASANAFTSFDITTYLFSATGHIMENIEILLNMCQETFLTDENVEKEKGIIGQEIRMYDDNPEWRSYFGVLQGLFKNHPIKIDIAGTIESISQITKEMLTTCFQTFYHPSNMAFFIVGPVKPEEVIDKIRENQAKKTFSRQAEIKRFFPEEPPTVANPRVETHLSVSLPRCLFGYKEVNPGVSGRSLLEREMVTAVVFDCLFSRSAELFNLLYNEGLIDRGFSWEYEVTPTYGFSVIGGNTKDPDRLMQTIQDYIEKTKERGITEEDFQRSRKKMIGKFLEGLDSPRYIARNFTSYRFKDVDFFDTLPILQEMTLDMVNDRLRNYFLQDAQAVSIVWPK